MAYNKTTWVNGQTPINETNLNKMENGIARTNTQTIDSDANLNDFTENGYYYFVAGHTYTNIPIGGNGWLEVINTGSTSSIKQIWYREGTLYTNDYQTFVRTCSSNTWSAWTEIVTTKETASFKGYLSNNTDLNNVTEPGIYSTGNATLTNAPISNYTWAFLIVLNQNNVIQQYLIKPVGGICYMREYSGSPSSWRDWRMPNQDNSWTNLTLSSSVFSGGTVRYFKQGNVVTVNITDLIPNSDISTHGTILASGLPNALTGVVFMLNRYKAPNSTSANCRVGVNTSGNLYLHYDTLYSGNNQYYGQVVYLATD